MFLVLEPIYDLHKKYPCKSLPKNEELELLKFVLVRITLKYYQLLSLLLLK